MQAAELLKESLYRPAPAGVEDTDALFRLPAEVPAELAPSQRNIRSFPYPVPAAWIYRPGRSVTQSGRAKARWWVLRFERREPSAPDPLMGWSGSGDTMQQVELKFPSREAAVAYAQSQGLEFRVLEPHSEKPSKRRYADNFRPRERPTVRSSSYGQPKPLAETPARAPEAAIFAEKGTTPASLARLGGRIAA